MMPAFARYLTNAEGCRALANIGQLPARRSAGNIYPGVGHAYMSNEGPNRGVEAIEVSWSRLFAWFHQYLPATELAAAR